MAPLEPGDPQEIGGYRLLGRLGAGGMGTVFLGRSAAGLMVAIKVVHEQFAGDPEFRARFRREVTTARAVSGAFTAPVIDADADASSPWLVTTFLEGKPLNEAVKEHGPLPPHGVASLGAGLAEALISIHRAGIVHRDLKPHNVMISPAGPRVIDFGIAHAAEISAITRVGDIIGSPGYMSPEQARGHHTGPPGDVFSLGAVLAFAATGTGPFGRGGLQILVYRVVHEAPRLEGVPDPRLRSLIAACLDKDPARRPTTQQILQWLGTAAPQGVSWLPDAMAAGIAAGPSPLGQDGGDGSSPGTFPQTVAHGTTRPPGSRGVSRRSLLIGAAGTAAVATAGALATAEAAGLPLLSGGGTGPATPRIPDGTLVAEHDTKAAVSGSPVVAGALVIVGSDSGKAHAFGPGGWTYDPRTGAEPVRMSPFSTRPAVAGPLVYLVSNEGALHAVDLKTGRRRWLRLPGTAPATPVAAGGLVYLRTGPGKDASLVGHDHTGAGRGELRMVGSEPVTDGPQVYVVLGEGIAVIKAGTVRVSTTIPSGHADVLAVGGGHLCGVKTLPGEMWVYDLRARRQSWTFKLASSGVKFTGGPAIADGIVFIGDTGGDLLAIRDGAVRWRFKTGGRVESAPAVTGGVVYFGCTDSYVYAVDAASGRPRSRFKTGGPIRSSTPAVAGGLVHVGSQDWNLYTVRL